MYVYIHTHTHTHTHHSNAHMAAEDGESNFERSLARLRTPASHRFLDFTKRNMVEVALQRILKTQRPVISTI